MQISFGQSAQQSKNKLADTPVSVEGSVAGKDISGKDAATIWKKEGSDWHIAFHTDMKVD